MISLRPFRRHSENESSPSFLLVRRKTVTILVVPTFQVLALALALAGTVKAANQNHALS